MDRDRREGFALACPGQGRAVRLDEAKLGKLSGCPRPRGAMAVPRWKGVLGMIWGRGGSASPEHDLQMGYPCWNPARVLPWG